MTLHRMFIAYALCKLIIELNWSESCVCVFSVVHDWGKCNSWSEEMKKILRNQMQLFVF